MIEGLKNCVFSICVSAVFGSILFYLFPDGKTTKLMKIVFGIFFICSIVNPIIDSDIFKVSWDENFFDGTAETDELVFDDLYGETETKTEDKIISATAEILNDYGVIYNKINADINISEGGSINIERFEVTAEETLDAKILSEIKNRVGAEPVQVYVG